MELKFTDIRTSALQKAADTHGAKDVGEFVQGLMDNLADSFIVQFTSPVTRLEYDRVVTARDEAIAAKNDAMEKLSAATASAGILVTSDVAVAEPPVKEVVSPS